ncbi:MAG: hypothetical protein ACK2UU_07835 [Anaerolineae bacterium]|jgi:hypothetical protein
MISSHPLDRLVEQDTFAEVLALLEPEELVIAALRLEDLTDDQIALLLDIDRANVRRRMEQACRRIAEALPELAPVLRDRRYRPACDLRPLNRGWLCPSIGGEPDPFASRPRDLIRQATAPRLPGQAEKGEPSLDGSTSLAMPERMVRAGTG